MEIGKIITIAAHVGGELIPLGGFAQDLIAEIAALATVPPVGPDGTALTPAQVAAKFAADIAIVDDIEHAADAEIAAVDPQAGPTFEEYVAAGYLAKNYPPTGYAAKASPGWDAYQAEQAAAAVTDPAAIEKALAGSVPASGPEAPTGTAVPTEKTSQPNS